MHKSFISVFVFFVLFVGIYIYGIIQSPLPYEVIDRDDSNIVSVMELIDSTDIGIRELGDCKEYYWLKDGLTAHEICSKT